MINKLYEDLEKARIELKPHIKNKSGIYNLVNLKNGKNYVGSSNNLYRRLNDYLNPKGIAKVLTKGESYIIKALLKYGYTNFGIKILEIIKIDSNFSLEEKMKLRIKREQHFIDLIKPEYNIITNMGEDSG